MNSTATTPLKNIFSFARFEDVVNEEDAAKLRDLDQDRQVVINTFDGFTYTIDMAPKRAAPPPKGSHPARHRQRELPPQRQGHRRSPRKRTPAADEKPEDAKKKDEEFAKQQEELKEQLATQKKLEGPRLRGHPLDRQLPHQGSRSDLVQAKAEPEPAAVTRSRGPDPVPFLRPFPKAGSARSHADPTPIPRPDPTPRPAPEPAPNLSGPPLLTHPGRSRPATGSSRSTPPAPTRPQVRSRSTIHRPACAHAYASVALAAPPRTACKSRPISFSFVRRNVMKSSDTLPRCRLHVQHDAPPHQTERRHST